MIKTDTLAKNYKEHGAPSEVLTRVMLREVYRMDVEIVNSAGAIHIVPICRHVC